MVIDLSVVNNRTINGLTFCRHVYSIFNKAQSTATGKQSLKLRESRSAKKLLEKLLPLTHFVQRRYHAGRNIKIRWIDDNQSFDAYILSSGGSVDHGVYKKKEYLEVTCAVHQEDYLIRQFLSEHGYAYGIKGVSRDKKTKKVSSIPYARRGYEAQDDFAKLIINLILKKSKIKYPRNTTLIVYCSLDNYFMDSEWEHMIKKIKKEKIPNKFREIYLFDNFEDHSFSFYK